MIEQQSNPRRKVEVVLSRNSLKIGKDPLALTVKSSHDGYVHLVLLGSDRKSFYLLFPNKLDGDNRIRANTTYRFPRPGWMVKAGGPEGVNHLLFVVSQSPRDPRVFVPTGSDDGGGAFTYAVTDLIAGNIQVAFFVPGNVQQFAKDGRLRLLGVSGTKRFKSTPQVPTLIEAGFKDFEATSWIGLLTTGGTPKPIIERYHRELVKILQSPEIRQKLEEMEFEVIASNPDQFAAWIATEIPRWGKVIKATGAKAD